jgi:hypothetical protein
MSTGYEPSRRRDDAGGPAPRRDDAGGPAPRRDDADGPAPRQQDVSSPEPPGGWCLAPHELCGADRDEWFETLWIQVCRLRVRFRLPVRSGWWRDWVQVEALAALAAWVARFDSGEWDDPPGKLGLLFDLERVTTLLRDGGDPFQPERDREAFVRETSKAGPGQGTLKF